MSDEIVINGQRYKEVWMHARVSEKACFGCGNDMGFGPKSVGPFMCTKCHNGLGRRLVVLERVRDTKEAT